MARCILFGIAILFAALIFLFVILFVALVIFGASSGTTVTLANGRVVSVSVRSIYHSIGTSGNTATIETLRAKVVVEPTKFTIDDQFIGPIPPGAKTVDVNIDGKKVNITADGVPVTPSGP
jgi:hypothetical protein